MLPNKGMKQTSVERIGRSQLIPSVRRRLAGRTSTLPGRGSARRLVAGLSRLRRPRGCGPTVTLLEASRLALALGKLRADE